MKRILIAAVISFGFASPALAGHCPKDVKRIDEALAGQSNAKVTELRDKGAKLHKEGSHGKSLAALHQAMKTLGLDH